MRLGPLVDEILAKHAYPEPVAKLLAEAIVLTVMLGSALKIEGRFILQTQTDGPVGLLVVDYTTPGKVRACARFGKEGVVAAVAAGNADAGSMLGKGHLAMTIDQGADMSRYQGLVALNGGSLEDAAHEHGAFGSPTFFVNGEIYFGKERLREVEDEIVRVAAAG